MDCYEFNPSMLMNDWREDLRPLLIVDLESWPAEIAMCPLPPVPILAIGEPSHPQALHADVIVDPILSLDLLVSRIVSKPRAAATLSRLLRVIEGLPIEHALAIESFAFAMLQGSEEHAGWLYERRAGASAAPGTLHVSREGSTLELRIDRPEARNMIDRHMRDALFDAFTLAALDPDIRCVRLSGNGRCFSLGADLGEFGTTRDPGAADNIRARTLPAYPMSRRAEIYHVHVHGGSVGSGLELAAFAGTLTASSNAWFQLPEIAMGILPGFGGCISIPRRIGRQRAAGLMLSGKRISAQIALDWGLVDRIVDDASVDNRSKNSRVA